MKTKKLSFKFIFVLFLCSSALIANPVQPIPNNFSEMNISDLVEKSNKELEKQLGIDFSLKEKIGLWAIKRKIKKAIKKQPDLVNKKLKDVPDIITNPDKEEKPFVIYGSIGFYLFGLALFFALFGVSFGLSTILLLRIIFLSLLFGLILFAINYVRHGENPGKYRGFKADRPWGGMCLMILAAFFISLITAVAFLLNAFL
jgi:hypothetical protein